MLKPVYPVILGHKNFKDKINVHIMYTLHDLHFSNITFLSLDTIANFTSRCSEVPNAHLSCIQIKQTSGILSLSIRGFNSLYIGSISSAIGYFNSDTWSMLTSQSSTSTGLYLTIITRHTV